MPEKGLRKFCSVTLDDIHIVRCLLGGSMYCSES